jgi:hypothetical protein
MACTNVLDDESANIPRVRHSSPNSRLDVAEIAWSMLARDPLFWQEILLEMLPPHIRTKKT